MKGIIQLVSTSEKYEENKYLVSDSQITFFKSVYQRHTNFSKEELIINPESRFDFGKEIVCKIKKQGDLLHRLFVVIQLPELLLLSKLLTIAVIEQQLSEVGIKWMNNYSKSKTIDSHVLNDFNNFIDSYIVANRQSNNDNVKQILLDCQNDLNYFSDTYHLLFYLIYSCPRLLKSIENLIYLDLYNYLYEMLYQNELNNKLATYHGNPNILILQSIENISFKKNMNYQTFLDEIYNKFQYFDNYEKLDTYLLLNYYLNKNNLVINNRNMFNNVKQQIVNYLFESLRANYEFIKIIIDLYKNVRYCDLLIAVSGNLCLLSNSIMNRFNRSIDIFQLSSYGAYVYDLYNRYVSEIGKINDQLNLINTDLINNINLIFNDFVHTNDIVNVNYLINTYPILFNKIVYERSISLIDVDELERIKNEINNN